MYLCRLNDVIRLYLHKLFTLLRGKIKHSSANTSLFPHFFSNYLLFSLFHLPAGEAEVALAGHEAQVLQGGFANVSFAFVFCAYPPKNAGFRAFTHNFATG
jgi:hypothetical protein